MEPGGSTQVPLGKRRVEEEEEGEDWLRAPSPPHLTPQPGLYLHCLGLPQQCPEDPSGLYPREAKRGPPSQLSPSISFTPPAEEVLLLFSTF